MARPSFIVRTWMTPSPETISPDATLEEARRRMSRGEFRHLPVVDGLEVVGIVSDRDLRTALAEYEWHEAEVDEGALEPPTVEAVMCTNPVVVSPNTPVAEAARLLIDLGIGALPVVDHGEIVGIFSEVDGLQALISALMQLRELSGTTRWETIGLTASPLDATQPAAEQLPDGGAEGELLVRPGNGLEDPARSARDDDIPGRREVEEFEAGAHPDDHLELEGLEDEDHEDENMDEAGGAAVGREDLDDDDDEDLDDDEPEDDDEFDDDDDEFEDDGFEDEELDDDEFDDDDDEPDDDDDELDDDDDELDDDEFDDDDDVDDDLEDDEFEDEDEEDDLDDEDLFDTLDGDEPDDLGGPSSQRSRRS